MLRRMVVDWRKWEDDRICWMVAAVRLGMRYADIVRCGHEMALSELLMVCSAWAKETGAERGNQQWSKFTDHLSDYFNFVTVRKLIYRLRHTMFMPNKHTHIMQYRVVFSVRSNLQPSSWIGLPESETLAYVKSKSEQTPTHLFNSVEKLAYGQIPSAFIWKIQEKKRNPLLMSFAQRNSRFPISNSKGVYCDLSLGRIMMRPVLAICLDMRKNSNSKQIEK